MNIPPDWKKMVYLVGYFFKFSPEGIEQMYIDDLRFWVNGIDEVAKFTGVV